MRRKTDSEGLPDRALSMFLAARFIGIDRYCKFAMWNINPGPILISSNTIRNVRVVAGSYAGTNLHMFDNVPYLRRFRADGKLFITSDHLPEPPNLFIKRFSTRTLADFCIDTMSMKGDMVLWLSAAGHRTSDAPFLPTGHYPILAGYRDESVLYVAAVKINQVYYFTCVEEGAYSVTYTDEFGETHNSRQFLVLTLRHDPSDITQPYPHIPDGAMDPTGPLHWLKFWPEKDPDYLAASDSAAMDDNLLEAHLRSCDGRAAGDQAWLWG